MTGSMPTWFVSGDHGQLKKSAATFLYSMLHSCKNVSGTRLPTTGGVIVHFDKIRQLEDLDNDNIIIETFLTNANILELASAGADGDGVGRSVTI
jgi:hypothetical protein